MIKISLLFIVVVLVICLAQFPPATFAQRPTSEKFKHAIERSEDSARLLSLLVEPNSGFPKELVDQAEIVAVFPHATRQEVLVRRVLQGYGVISARQGSGWSLPAFYQFVSAPRKSSGSSGETLALVLLFMNKNAASWFEKDKSKFKGNRAGILGPVSAVAEEQRTPSAGAQIIAYTYFNGKLNGKGIDPDFFRNFILDQDNNINIPLERATKC